MWKVENPGETLQTRWCRAQEIVDYQALKQTVRVSINRKAARIESWTVGNFQCVREFAMIGQMEPTELTLRKPNAALVMVHRAGKLTGIERKLFSSVLLSSITQLNAYRQVHGKDPDNRYLYSAPADELLDPIEVGKSNLKSSLRKHMTSLRRAEVDWEAPDARSGVVWKNLSVLSQAEIEIRNGRLYALWALPPDLNAAISDPSKFPYTKLDLSKVAQLHGYTAVALYDICARYRNNFLRGGDGVCLTSASSPDWWVDALTNNIPKVDKKTGVVTRREWRKVKNEAVLKAIEEINAVTDLDIELIETKKKGEKAISLVQFSLRQKRMPAKEIPQSHYELIRSGIRAGLPQAKIELALESYSVGQVGIALAKFEARSNRTDLAPVEKPVTYFNSLFQGNTPIELVEDHTAVSGGSGPQTNSAAISNVQTQRSIVRNEFMTLSDQDKVEYGRRALEALNEKGIATPKIILNAEERVWSGVLLSKMVEIFAHDKYGPNWEQKAT